MVLSGVCLQPLDVAFHSIGGFVFSGLCLRGGRRFVVRIFLAIYRNLLEEMHCCWDLGLLSH